MRKFVFLAAFSLLSAPLISFAQVTSNYFVATDTTATSTLNGGLSVGESLNLPWLSNGILSSSGGYAWTTPTFVYNPATGWLGVGTSTQDNVNHFWQFVKQTSSANGATLSITDFNSGGAMPAPGITFRSSRGTQAGPSAVQTSDTIGRISFSGFDGTVFPGTAPAGIVGFADDNWTSTDHGAGMNFSVTADGTTTRTTAMTLSNSGTLIVGPTNTPKSILLNGPAGMLSVGSSAEIGTTSVYVSPGLTVDGAAYFSGNMSIATATQKVNPGLTVDGGVWITGNTPNNALTVTGRSAFTTYAMVGTTSGYINPGLTVDGGIYVTSASSSMGWAWGGLIAQGNVISGNPNTNDVVIAGGASGILTVGTSTSFFPSQGVTVDGDEDVTGFVNVFNDVGIGIGQTHPTLPLMVSSQGTTTVQIDSASASQGSCLIMKDSDGGGYTYITTYRGTLIASTNPCN